MVTKQKVCYNKEWTFNENKEFEPIQQVQMIISQVIICKIDFDWLHFDNEPRMQ